MLQETFSPEFDIPTSPRSTPQHGVLYHRLGWHELKPMYLLSSDIFPGKSMEVKLMWIWRSAVLVYLCICIILGLSLAKWKGGDGKWWGGHLVDVNVLCMLFYFLSLSVLHFKFQKDLGRPSDYQTEGAGANSFERLLWVWFELLTPGIYFLSFVYWVLTPDVSAGVYGFICFALNPAILTIELLLNQLPSHLFHTVFWFLCGIIYFVVAWMARGISGGYYLSFLESKPGWIVYILLVVVALIFWFVTKALVHVRGIIAFEVEKHRRFQELRDWEKAESKGGFSTDDEEELL
ncbi:hypothetical protein PROFUN_14057 [Planoprotostelium fungivorum]|uniref:Uncharacterized protein n=1 Tax=Planoprotostelium fungivorum TaxID=1890364 RepID=A0A2P6MYX3_9EUKA|nr:hypothetical protein PROFUN_15689 [Planoprotostelium fungivorum]PRP78019.1 hypothetical protein PROFUN_14057 [Planoprotostelium fungivorum]